MRAFDRDLIRGGHYGQRSCEPHPKAEHMAAPTQACYVRFSLPTRSRPHMAHIASIRGNAALWLLSERSGHDRAPLTEKRYEYASLGSFRMALGAMARDRSNSA